VFQRNWFYVNFLRVIVANVSIVSFSRLVHQFPPRTSIIFDSGTTVTPITVVIRWWWNRSSSFPVLPPATNRDVNEDYVEPRARWK